MPNIGSDKYRRISIVCVHADGYVGFGRKCRKSTNFAVGTALHGYGSKVGNVQARSAKPDIPENTLSRFGWYRRFVNSQSSGQYRLTDDKITV